MDNSILFDVKSISDEDFNYFVKYLKTSVNNHYKDLSKKIRKPIFENDLKQDKKTGDWNLASHFSNNCLLNYWEYDTCNEIKNRLKVSKNERIKNVVKNYHRTTQLISSVLNNDNYKIEILKKEFYRIKYDKQFIDTNRYYVYAIPLLTSNFEIKIIDSENKDINIRFCKVLPKNIERIYALADKFFIDNTVDLMCLGLFIDISTAQILEDRNYKIKENTYKKDISQDTLGKEYKICEIILKLKKIASINSNFVDFHEDGICNNCTLSHATNSKPICYSDMLKKTDIYGIKKFYNFFRNKIVDYKLINYNGNKTISPFYVALEKYNEALNIPSYEIEKIVTYIVMGLEAIYTSKNNDLAYALRMRISAIFNMFLSTKVSNIPDIIKLAYNIRSDYAHGGTNREKNNKKLLEQFNGNQKECVKTLLNILRISLNLILILDFGKTQKDITKFQEILDSIMTGDKLQYKEFKNKIKKYHRWL